MPVATLANERECPDIDSFSVVIIFMYLLIAEKKKSCIGIDNCPFVKEDEKQSVMSPRFILEVFLFYWIWKPLEGLELYRSPCFLSSWQLHYQMREIIEFLTGMKQWLETVLYYS